MNNLLEENGGLTPEEIEAWDEAYKKYSTMHDLYEQAIALEDDPTRQAQLRRLLASLREDNG